MPDTRKTDALLPLTDALLPLRLPDARIDRILLVMMRRMSACGLYDASTALIALNQFGGGFAKPLNLLRIFMAQLAQAARDEAARDEAAGDAAARGETAQAEATQGQITLAPCCAMAMTRDEGLLIETLAQASGNSARAMRNLQLLTSARNVGQPLASAFALSTALAALGLPPGLS